MIRTVLGDIENLSGTILMHEHIQNVSNDMIQAFGNKWLDERKLEDYAVSVLSKLKDEINLSVFVDGTPIDLGRNVRLLKRVSEKTGVHIVASTGLYYYPSMVSCMRSAEELAEWFLYECKNGMEGTDIKPGILKCAADTMGITDDVKKRLEALAITQSKTGLPMYAHCSHTDNLAQEMIDIFERKGAELRKIIIGHASRKLDVDYLVKILRRGCYICIDQSLYGDEAKVAKVVYDLCERGYHSQLLFSQDKAMYNDFECSSRVGMKNKSDDILRYSYLTNNLITEFKEIGCTDEECKSFLCNNALTVLDI